MLYGALIVGSKRQSMSSDVNRKGQTCLESEEKRQML